MPGGYETEIAGQGGEDGALVGSVIQKGNTAMKLTRSTSVLEYKLVSSFENVRKKLLQPKFAERLEKPLAYWALPGDRRLPLAFMGRALRDLLDTPFEELYATPGIGQKKIHSLIELLNRAAKEQPIGALAAEVEQVERPNAAADIVALAGSTDPGIVSEALWEQWRASVRDFSLGREPLGRFALSLQNLPRVIWQTPLDTYLGLSLDEIRSLKTHGEKRVRAVLEVFGALHAILARAGRQDHLTVKIMPRFARDLEIWTEGVLNRDGLPTADELMQSFVEPLMAQARIDAGDQIAKLVENRLGLKGANSSVRQAARKMGLTRARVYQLLNEVGAVMDVRWPEGRPLVHRLRDKLIFATGGRSEFSTFLSTVELFFPRPGRDEELAQLEDGEVEENEEIDA
jgi:hypothetical protein